METTKLKRFAQYARRSLMEQVATKLKQVLADESAARRENLQAIKKLEEAIHLQGKEQVIERVAYIWFNRFCALRFMDVNRYTRIGVVSAAEGQFQPEILAEAKMGHIDEELANEKSRQQIFDLLSGKVPSHDAQGEAYRKLVVAACNFWNKAMPFLFERIDDYTELLMQDDLLSGNSILAYTREAMTSDTCQNVEVIGWLYQFYISEKKDAVIGKVVKDEDIPAATQLFTPNWIVKYMVQNSVGRLWLMANPHSDLKEKCQLDYYIQPAEQSVEVQEKLNALIQSRIAVDGQFLNPETLSVLDPACGSGHILVEAYDILKGIYEERGYEPRAIPRLILEKNLFGIDIDERAAQLASFALMMKARADDKRIFSRGVRLNVVALQSSEGGNLPLLWQRLNLNAHRQRGQTASLFEEAQLDLSDSLDHFQYELLQDLLLLFRQVKTVGSLVRMPFDFVEPLVDLAGQLQDLQVNGDTFQQQAAGVLLPFVLQGLLLGRRYDVVVANPPYMGSKGMNPELKEFAKKQFPDSKSDLFAMFIERGFELAKPTGFNAQVTMQSWMFLSSYEAMREKLLSQKTLNTMAHLGARAFSEISGEVVQTTVFVFHGDYFSGYKPAFFRLVDGNEEQKQTALLSGQNRFDKTVQEDFKKISGSPVAYWASGRMLKAFENGILLKNIAIPRQGLATMDNAKFTRFWHEVSIENSSNFSKKSKCKWYPYNKGGDYRKWYGNQELLVNWENSGNEIKQLSISRYGSASKRVVNEESYFLQSVTWSKISSSKPSFRFQPEGAVFDVAGMSLFPSKNELPLLLMLLNSKIALQILELLSPTLNFEAGQIGAIPVIKPENIDDSICEKLIDIAKNDWNNYETSWDFTENPLIRQKQNTQQGLTVRPELVEGGTVKPLMVRQAHHERLNLNTITIEQCFNQWQTQNRAAIVEMKRLEEENNRLFIEAYGLQDELSPDVPEEQITLVRADREKDCRDFISYSVGCLFGRYSLDKTGLILASQGETLADYLKHIPEPTLMPCENNVLPILDGDWFSDDLSARFRQFLRVSFGEKQYEENLTFIEESLGKKIGQYFVKDFYNDHIKRYKKRPIYWLFSSPKGSFNALIYLHRYRPDTVSVVLNEYLREFRTKLTAHKTHLEAISISANATQSEKTKALKEIEKFSKIILELEDYEREVLYPLATKQLPLDLDDGVKVNYQKFGLALKKIAGLDAQEDS